MESFYQEEMATIYCGNALEVLRELPDESNQMAMTSPPYWGLRNYAGGSNVIWGGEEDCQHDWVETTQGLQHENRNNLIGTQEEVVGKTATAFIQKYDRLPAGFCRLCSAWRGQLGLEPTPELYVEHLMMIFREVKRVLRKDGSFYLNIGDTYFSNPSNQQGHGFGKSRAGARAAFENLGRQKRIFTNGILKPKCMVCIPERVMFAMIEDGWTLCNKIIWKNQTPCQGAKKVDLPPLGNTYISLSRIVKLSSGAIEKPVNGGILDQPNKRTTLGVVCISIKKLVSSAGKSLLKAKRITG